MAGVGTSWQLGIPGGNPGTDGIKILVTRRAPPSVAALEQILNEVRNLYKPKFGYSVISMCCKDDIEFLVTRRTAPSMTALHRCLSTM